MDLSAAEAHPGVLRVLTADDIPGDKHIGLIKQDWPLMISVGETTRYVGDVLAVVIAETDEIAREGVALIEVDYEVLEPVTDMHAALQEDSPSVHEGGKRSVAVDHQPRRPRERDGGRCLYDAWHIRKRR